MGIDKIKAKNNLWRIPEKKLFLISFLGGFIGILISMYLFNHKLKKTRFYIVVIASLIIHFIILYLLPTQLSLFFS